MPGPYPEILIGSFDLGTGFREISVKISLDAHPRLETKEPTQYASVEHSLGYPIPFQDILGSPNT